MVAVVVTPAGRAPSFAKGLPITVDLTDKSLDTATVGDIKTAIAQKFPKFYEARQKLALKGDRKPLADETTLKAAGVTDGGELTVKDLGAQISWRTVFLYEYGGPLVIHSLFYFFPTLFFGVNVQHSLLQKYLYAIVMLHFIKRELETIFVHRFSNGSMPYRSLARNCAHYWILGGLVLGYSVFSPTYSAVSPYIRDTIRDDPNFLIACTIIWAAAELANARTHIILRDLRPKGTKTRKIPYGFGFDLVTCPNYTFEILGWIAVSVMTNSYSAHVFLLAGAYIQTVWAIKKYKNYRKEFGNQYPKGRKIIFPFIF